MTQLPIFSIPVWTVSEITRYLREILESDELLQDVWVLGEVSNLSRPTSGHIYFTIKDSRSALRCVIWRNSAPRLSNALREGQAVEVHGGIGVYETAGQYQLYVDLIRPAGEGALYQQFMRLKARLEAEGLFDEERKRPIPTWPKRIGVVTSPTGAALQDVLNILRRRFPIAEVVLSPTAVQGEEAPAGIISALQSLNEYVHPDVILVVRGGGSIEDLWAFNDERVARAIAASTAPVISGVGHETDFTIADFVSDLRAPTPTAAAELATPSRQELLAAIDNQNKRIKQAVAERLFSFRMRLQRENNRLKARSPFSQIRSLRQRIDELNRQIGTQFEHLLQMRRLSLQSLMKQLYSLNPLAVLQRGYAILSRPDGEVIKSVHQIETNTLLNAQLSDGSVPILARPKVIGNTWIEIQNEESKSQ